MVARPLAFCDSETNRPVYSGVNAPFRPAGTASFTLTVVKSFSGRNAYQSPNKSRAQTMATKVFFPFHAFDINLIIILGQGNWRGPQPRVARREGLLLERSCPKRDVEPFAIDGYRLVFAQIHIGGERVVLISFGAF